jgi:N6-adenosine-specific RNA methylase IME4
VTLQSHPYADLFPLIEGAEFEAFAADLKENGLREQIVLLDNLILDGRNRYRAAELLGLPAAQGDADSFREFHPDTEGDPLKWVLSKNLARRHLDVNQRAMVAASLATMRQGERTDLEPSAKLQKVGQETAAQQLNVSVRSLGSAKVVQEKGTPELRKLVEQGKLPVSQAEKAAKQSPEIQARVVQLTEAGKANAVRTAIKQAERNGREATLGAKQKALPDRKFGIILADPEHRFEVFSRETGLDRAADNHYPTTDQRLLLLREIPKISAKDCMCVLWITDLARGIRILESWGFAFKSYRVWAKDIVEGPRNDKGQRTYVEVGPAGTGFWFRDRDELVLVGTRGNFVAPAMGTQPESILFAARPKIEGSLRGRHSAKPEEVHRWIEANWPNTPKIELNARAGRPGWEVWGNEAPEDGIPAGSRVGELGRPEETEGATASALAQVSAGGGPEGNNQIELDTGPNPDAVASAAGPVSDGDAEAVRRDTAPRWQDRYDAPPPIPEIPAFLLRTSAKEDTG